MCKKADNWCREEKMGCKGCAYCTENKNGMTIKTKFKIGQKVWVLDVNRNAIDVFSTEINGIYIDEDYNIQYYFRKYCDDIPEENIADYNDINALYDKLKTLDKKNINIKED
jgi:hypothetical protein